MTAFVCVRTSDKVSWFESEQHYYNGDPTVTLTFDRTNQLWHGKSHHPTTAAMTPSVGEGFRRLANFPNSDVSDLITHVVAEPGAPLEPVPVRSVPA